MCKVQSTFCGTLIDKVTANQDALTCFYLLHSTPMYKNTDAKTAEFQSRKRKSKRTGEGNKENSEYDGSLDESKSIDELPPLPGAVFENDGDLLVGATSPGLLPAAHNKAAVGFNVENQDELSDPRPHGNWNEDDTNEKEDGTIYSGKGKV